MHAWGLADQIDSNNTIFFNREGGDQGKDWSPEEGHHHDPEWWEAARTADDDNPLFAATSRPHHQKAAADFLGDRSQNNWRWKTASGDDPGLWCLQEGEIHRLTP